METNIISELTTFIEHAPTAFHAVAELKEILKQEGFEELKESEKWKVKPGKRYYVTRNNSSIIAVKAGKELDNYSFHVTASHSDSPAFKLKENAEIEVAKKYTVLNTEGYGGMICQTWFDRPLSLAGRVMVKNGERIETRLAELKEIRLSGDMKRYGEVEEFLHFLKISTGAHFSVKNKTIVVSIK